MQDNTGSPVIVRLSADVTTVNTTATDITGLNFVIGPNEVWHFEVYANIGTSSAAGTQYAINFPTGATLWSVAEGTSTANGLHIQIEITAAATLTTSSFNTTAALTTAALGAFLNIRGTIANGATAGVVQFQHAKTTSGTATVYAGAYLRAHRIS
jgi:hypothetical protein